MSENYYHKQLEFNSIFSIDQIKLKLNLNPLLKKNVHASSSQKNRGIYGQKYTVTFRIMKDSGITEAVLKEFYKTMLLGKIVKVTLKPDFLNNTNNSIISIIASLAPDFMHVADLLNFNGQVIVFLYKYNDGLLGKFTQRLQTLFETKEISIEN